MAKGLAVPVRPGKNGGAVIVSGSEQNRKILSLAIAPGEDNNAFQDLGFSEGIVFANPDSPTKAIVQNAIQKIVAKYPDRFKILNPDSIQIVTGAGGDTTISFSYRELDSGENKTYTGSLSNG